LHTFTVNFSVYFEVCRYPKKNNFYSILGNLPRFGKHWFSEIIANCSENHKPDMLYELCAQNVKCVNVVSIVNTVL
jgi:hypothetical protein